MGVHCSALSPLSLTSLFVALSISEGIEQLSGEVLRALIDFQKSLGRLGSRLEKNRLLELRDNFISGSFE